MSSFEKFIESDAFFPVLILLLVALIGVFIWVIVSNNNAMKKQRQRKNIVLDENAEIKVVADPTKPSEPVRTVKEEEVGGSEIRIVAPSNKLDEEVKPVEQEVETGGDELKIYNTEAAPIDEDFDIPDIEEAPINLDIPEVVDEVIPSSIDEPKEENEPNAFDNVFKIEDAPVIETPEVEETNLVIPPVDIVTEISKEDEVEEENEIPSVTIEPEVTSEEDEDDDIELPITKVMSEESAKKAIEEAASVIEELKSIDIDKELENSIFNSKPTDNHEINDNIVFEPPKEYVGEKTEIFDFDLTQVEKEAEVSVEEEIINAANKYIEEIMKKED